MFRSPLHFVGFAEFERLVIQVTHSSHQLTAATHERVRSTFARFANEHGADFEQPIRLDLLRRPARD